MSAEKTSCDEAPRLDTEDLDRDIEQTRDEMRSEANTYLVAGAGIGAWGAISVAALGAVCPLCFVAAPALVGYGAYQRYCLRKSNAAAGELDDAGPVEHEGATIRAPRGAE
jgi:hypothetical protein